MNLLPTSNSDLKHSLSGLLLLWAMAGVMACQAPPPTDKGVRVAFVEAYNKTMEQESTGCSLKLEGRTARRAHLQCPEVEPETVAQMVKVMCEDMAKIGFGKVAFSSEAQGGKCSVKRCTCELDSASPSKGDGNGQAADAGSAASAASADTGNQSPVRADAAP